MKGEEFLQNELNGEERGTPGTEKENYFINILLFLLTILTTSFIGAIFEGVDVFKHPLDIYYGLPYSITLMFILGSHELGHYMAARRIGISATPPYFIPVPFFLGTFGAFIKIKKPVYSRKSLLYIGLAGPLTGFIVSIIAIFIGLQTSKIAPKPPAGEGIILGEPLALKIISDIIFPLIPQEHDIYLSSVAFAGWIGLLLTSMNLIPIGQLDGGHISAALLPRRVSTFLSFICLFLLIWAGIFMWPGWLVWALLNTLICVVHPPLFDIKKPDLKDYLLGIVILLVFILSFTPRPVDLRGILY